MKISHSLLLVLLGFVLLSGTAHAACAEADKDCMEKLKEAWNETSEQQDSSVQSSVDRVETVGKAVKQCIECATDTVVNSINQVNSDPNAQPVDDDHPR